MLDLGGSRAEIVSMHAPSYQTVNVWFLFFMYAPLLSRRDPEDSLVEEGSGYPSNLGHVLVPIIQLLTSCRPSGRGVLEEGYLYRWLSWWAPIEDFSRRPQCVTI